MEKNLSNKQQFFIQYWGQRVWVRPQRDGTNYLLYIDSGTIYYKKGNIEQDYLKLTPLSWITNEDATYISKIENNSQTKDHAVRGKVLVDNFVTYGDCTHSMNNSYQFLEMIYYLRSKGYALPWNGLTVEQLISYGWLRLKEEK